MKTVAKIIAAIALVVMLAGCSSWTGTGTVVSKHHRDSFTTTVMVSCGKNCLMPQITTYPDYYGLTVQAEDGQHDVSVTADTYQTVSVGQTFTAK